jgi:hypothetical protein
MKGFTRPRAAVLSEKAVVPARNVISPAPNRFTHVVARTVPYYYDKRSAKKAPDGELPSGTRVVLLHQGSRDCRVVDGRGLYVLIACDHLESLPDGSP